MRPGRPSVRHEQLRTDLGVSELAQRLASDFWASLGGRGASLLSLGNGTSRSSRSRLPDIFDLLDERVIRELATIGQETRPFPGHEAARGALARTRGKHNEFAYKSFLYNTYGVSTTAPAIRTVARKMREAEIAPPTRLATIIHQVEELATEASSS
jgi:hypothetical protein